MYAVKRESCIWGDYFSIWKVATDDEVGVIAAFPTREEAEAFIKANGLHVGYDETGEKEYLR